LNNLKRFFIFQSVLLYLNINYCNNLKIVSYLKILFKILNYLLNTTVALVYKVNFRFFSMIIWLWLGLYICISFTSISNSMAHANLSIEVSEHGNISIFSSLSRDFDRTIGNTSDDNQNSTTTTTTTTNDAERLEE
jgi:hypothetical protein